MCTHASVPRAFIHSSARSTRTRKVYEKLALWAFSPICTVDSNDDDDHDGWRTFFSSGCKATTAKGPPSHLPKAQIESEPFLLIFCQQKARTHKVFSYFHVRSLCLKGARSGWVLLYNNKKQSHMTYPNKNFMVDFKSLCCCFSFLSIFPPRTRECSLS